MKKIIMLSFLLSLTSFFAFGQKPRFSTQVNTQTQSTSHIQPTSPTKIEAPTVVDLKTVVPKELAGLPLFKTRVTYPKGLKLNEMPQVQVWTWQSQNSEMAFLENLYVKPDLQYVTYGTPYEDGDRMAIDIQAYIPNSNQQNGKVIVVLTNANGMFEPYCDVNNNATVQASYNRKVLQNGSFFPCIIFEPNDPHGGFGVVCVAIPK